LVAQTQHDPAGPLVDRVESRHNRRGTTSRESNILHDRAVAEIDGAAHFRSGSTDSHHHLLTRRFKRCVDCRLQQRPTAVLEELFRLSQASRRTGTENQPGDKSIAAVAR